MHNLILNKQKSDHEVNWQFVEMSSWYRTIVKKQNNGPVYEMYVKLPIKNLI